MVILEAPVLLTKSAWPSWEQLRAELKASQGAKEMEGERETQREREREIYIYIDIHIYIHIYV